jgi:four helix bundle protein
MKESYKFQKLDFYKLALDYVKAIYSLRQMIPDRERFNLVSQIERAATSIALNIAEGSTGQSNLEQKRFLGLAIRSYLETIACLDLIENLEYLSENETNPIREQGHQLFIKLSAFRKALK